ncbi:MAG: tRNA (N6-isopentenyl adenosine(37)-C2)-methylthiotransferase MiaB [Legionellales bacterium]|nr:tRNA (N6-isopentenyl adenosine(37)-C2)-methylthiotransferase MiaB [Legionellales bacterium]|tara:strand:+ start:4381 stop:5715 length:1335 start_codon:yes stop_codon:yes gene_type:complete
MKNFKLYIQTYGCQMNVYDSDKMVDILSAKMNIKVTDKESDADILLMNTCSIREKAQEKVFSELGRWRKLKVANPNLIIGVGGCVASQEAEKIHQRAPSVDIVFGPQTLHHLPKMVNAIISKKEKITDISFDPIKKFDQLPTPGKTGPSAFVSIMEGCSKFCSFCIVPYTRGPEISRSVEDVLLEVNHLLSLGAKEIHLLGQNVNNYKSEFQGELFNLAALIRLVASMKGVERIRFTTSHPAVFDDSLVEAYKDVPQLPNYLHLPIQSASDRILMDMKRGYSQLDYRQIISKLRKVRPNISISSDFIVGYPGETSNDFEQTLKLVEQLNIDHSYSFIYSPRPGTPASFKEDNVSLEEKKSRLNTLQKLIQSNAFKISQSMVGTVEQVLITGYSSKSKEDLAGKTGNNRTVNIKGDSHLIGEMVDCEITKANLNSLNGQILEYVV